MKKLNILIALIFLLSILSSCNNKNIKYDKNENTNPYITTDKFYYNKDEKIIINNYNCNPEYTVCVIKQGLEPINATRHVRSKTNTNIDEIETNDLDSYGDYYVYLVDENYITLDKKPIFIYDSDETNYSITSALINEKNITINTSTHKEITYKLYWAKDNIRLINYTPIKTIVSKNQDVINIILNEHLLMPCEANQIEIAVMEGKSNSIFIDCSTIDKHNKSDLLYTFNVISDIHIYSENTSNSYTNHFINSLDDISKNNPNSSCLISVGDNTNTGVLEEYQALNNLLKNYLFINKLPIYFTIGNHDYMYNQSYVDALNMHKEWTKMNGNYSSITINNNKFIFLGSDTLSSYGIIQSEQLNWFENELKKANPNQPIFIFIHQPLENTVSGSLKSNDSNIQDAAGFLGDNGSNQIKNILKNYPNAIVFSGHSHWTLDGDNTILNGNNENANYVHVPSVAYIVNDKNETIESSQGLYVEVYKDSVIIIGKEFIQRNYISAMQMLIQIK